MFLTIVIFLLPFFFCVTDLIEGNLRVNLILLYDTKHPIVKRVSLLYSRPREHMSLFSFTLRPIYLSLCDLFAIVATSSFFSLRDTGPGASQRVRLWVFLRELALPRPRARIESTGYSRQMFRITFFLPFEELHTLPPWTVSAWHNSHCASIVCCYSANCANWGPSGDPKRLRLVFVDTSCRRNVSSSCKREK